MISSFSFSKEARLTDVERSWLKDFSCRRDSQCFKPSDRATVLAAIRAEWGTEERFDNFVQTKLVEIFETSKRAYQSKIRNTAQRAFELTFGG